MRKQLLTAAFATLLACSTAQAQVVVRIGPPPPRHEVIPARPTEHLGWVWAPGFHRWDGSAYVWVAGHYAEPPRPRARWVPGHWVRRPGGWVFAEGHWR
ncbi:MAG TPA: hypothetical protein VHU44_10755 [Acidobacteriaceae bacterium]|jgi:hypothetical protein|nr:hypothetical protein [Acidobacteriaceae bacterium]